MVSLTQLAQTIEQGLTSQLNDPNIDFKIWASAGEYSKSVRSGNTVQSYIQGTLLSSSSSNEGNILSMGYNGLQLYLSVPLQAPKTLSTQTSEELQKIKNGSDYPFLTLVLSALDAYFSVASVMQLTDDAGTEYTISMVAGRAITGNVDVAAQFGNNLTVSLLIGVYFLQGGISARTVVVNIDGVRVPLSSVTINRANQKSSDVYQGGTSVKNVSSATALSIDFAFPANSDNTTNQAIRALYAGNANMAHFVELSIGSQYDGKFLMMFDNLNLAAQNVQFAGITGALIECVDNVSLLSFPNYMQVGYFSFANSSAANVSFSASSSEYMAYISGRVYMMSLASAYVNLLPEDFIYDPTTNQYRVYMVTLGAVTVSDSNAPFTIVQEALGNVIE